MSHLSFADHHHAFCFNLFNCLATFHATLALWLNPGSLILIIIIMSILFLNDIHHSFHPHSSLRHTTALPFFSIPHLMLARFKHILHISIKWHSLLYWISQAMMATLHCLPKYHTARMLHPVNIIIQDWSGDILCCKIYCNTRQVTPYEAEENKHACHHLFCHS